MRVLSLFDGISCARVALDKLGIPVEVYLASEIDKYALQVSAKNWPDIVQVGDVERVYFNELANIDLLIGGSPCQDLSIAKAGREGLAGTRSKLFYEYVRIMQECKPKYFVLENVASMSKEAKAAMTEIMGVEPIMIDAGLVSGQRRKRLFWTNIPNVVLPNDKGILLRDVLEPTVDDKYIYSGKINNASQGTRLHSIDGKSVTLSALGGGAGAKTGLYAVPIDKHGNEKTKSNTLRTSGMGSGVDDKHNWDAVRVQSADGTVIRRLTPRECERLQCVPDGYTEGLSDTQRYKALGNAFNADVIAHILSFLPEELRGSHV